MEIIRRYLWLVKAVREYDKPTELLEEQIEYFTLRKFPAPPRPATLADVLLALDSGARLTESRLRDARSSVRRVARLVGDEPTRIPLDMPAISATLATISPAAAGLTAKASTTSDRTSWPP